MEGVDHCSHVLVLIQVHSLEQIRLFYSILFTSAKEIADVFHLHEGHLHFVNFLHRSWVYFVDHPERVSLLSRQLEIHVKPLTTYNKILVILKNKARRHLHIYMGTNHTMYSILMRSIIKVSVSNTPPSALYPHAHAYI